MLVACFVVNSNDKEGLQWFVCPVNGRVRLELFTILVWETLSSTHVMRTKGTVLGLSTPHDMCTKRRKK